MRREDQASGPIQSCSGCSQPITWLGFSPDCLLVLPGNGQRRHRHRAASGAARVRVAALALALLAVLGLGSPAEAQYGNQYYRTAVATFSTTSTTFVPVAPTCGLTVLCPPGRLQFTPASASEVWIVLFSAALRSTTVGTALSAEVQYTVNGVPHGIGGIQSDSGDIPGPSWQHFYRITGTTAQQTVEVQLRDASGGPATLTNLQIVAFRLPPNADFQYAENEGTQGVAALSWNPYQTLTFTPSSAGQYLVMALVNAQDGPGLNTVMMRLRDPAAAFWPVDLGSAPNFLANGRIAWQSYFLARAQNLAVASQTYTLQANANAGAGGQVRYTRIMAFRTDAFASYEAAQAAADLADSSCTSGEPAVIVKSTLTTAKPLSSRDYVVLQSLLLRNFSSGARSRNASFRADGVVRTNHAHEITDGSYHSTYGHFDAVTTSRSVVYENTCSVSSTAGGHQAFARESTIHVLALPPSRPVMSVTPTAWGTPGAACAPHARNGRYYSVKARYGFEMVFNTAVGGGIECFWDLAEDPLKEYDFAGFAAANAGSKALMKVGFNAPLASGWFHPDDNHEDTAQASWSGSRPRLDVLESTGARVRVRQEAFYQELNAATILPGVKVLFDYSVYPVGKMGLRVNRRTTQSVAYNTQAVEMSAQGGAGSDPRSKVVICSQQDCDIQFASSPTFNAADDDYLLTLRDQVTWITNPTKSGGARTDMLDILYQDWLTGASYKGGALWVEGNENDKMVNWRGNTGTPLGAPPGAGSSETWNQLVYLKPNTFASNTDTAVTYRRDDYRRASNTITSFTKGETWRDGSENSAADDFNESEGAYVLNADPTPGSEGATFVLTGTPTLPRYAPFFKIRRWRSPNQPSWVKLNAATMAPVTDYLASVKPVARAHFARDLTWHSTMQSAGAITSPDVGGAGTPSAGAYVAGRFGNGFQVSANGDYVDVPIPGSFNAATGALEFWFQPSYASNDGSDHDLAGFYTDNSNQFFLRKESAAQDLVFTIVANGATSTYRVLAANYSWRSSDWVHVRMEWNDGVACSPTCLGQQRILLNGVEPPHTDSTVDYVSADLSLAAGVFAIGRYRTGATRSNGVYDEVHFYGSSSTTPAPLAAGGLIPDANEYLAVRAPSRDATLDFGLVDGSRRGRYLYFGVDAEFQGLNVELTTTGAGSSPNLKWEFWDGVNGAWSDLEAGCPGSCTYGFADGTTSLTQNGSVSWTAPANWQPLSVNGGPDLYYVRASLASGDYATRSPVESRIFSDLLLLQYFGDVTAADTFDVGPPLTTAVGLEFFDARGVANGVELAWRTGSELDNLGFHLHRSTTEAGPYERLTTSLIPGLGSSPIGASYSWLDRGVVPGQRYYYKLEDVDTRSVSTWHGPVHASFPPGGDGAGGGGGNEAPGEGDSGGDGSGPGEGDSGGDGSGPGDGDSGGDGEESPPTGSTETCPSWLLAIHSVPDSTSPSCSRYGSPDPPTLTVLSRTSRSAELELRTGGFWTVDDPDGTVRAYVPGFDASRDPAAPALPLKRALVDAVVGRNARLASAEAFDLLAFPGLRPAATGRVEMGVSKDGTVRPVRRALPVELAPEGPTPADPARLAGTVFQGEKKSAVVELQPLRYDGAGGGLVLATRLRVRLSFEGRAPGESGNGTQGRLARREWKPVQDVLAQLYTTRPGLHAVRYEEVFPGRRRALETSLLRLQRDGEAVAFHVEPDAGLFGPGSVLHFHAERGARSTDFTGEVAYELVRSAEGTRMETVDGAPSGEPAASAPVGRLVFEVNRIYQSGLLEADDPWQWENLTSGVLRTKGFTLLGLDGSASAGPARVVVHLQGGSESGAEVDHHVRVSVNGVFAGETRFAGRRPHRLEAEVPALALREGANEIEVLNVGDTGVSSLVFLDRYEVEHPRKPQASEGSLEGQWNESGTVEVGGLSGPPVVLDVTASGTPGGTVRWLSFPLTDGGTVRFHADAERRYLVATAAGILSPRVVRPAPSTLRDARNQADYVLIAPASFLPAAAPLLVRRASEGLAVKAVSLEEVGAVFGHATVSGEAIRRFVSHAYHAWAKPSPRYVVLLGDATFDPQHFVSSSWPSPMPALWGKTSYLWTALDPVMGAVNGEDEVPDVAVGRIPATTVEQAGSLIAKILAWEDSGQGLGGKAALVADNPDAAGDFEWDVEDIRSSFLSDRETDVLKVGELGAAGTRAAVQAAFDGGLSLLGYVGHGGSAVWASENVWNSWDAPKLLAQSRQPLLLTLNCLNGYFVASNFDSLSESLLKVAGRGAVAAVSPSGLSVDGPAHQYHRALMQQLVSGGHERLGDALQAAQVAYAETGLMPELLSVYHLFGDPALRLGPGGVR